MLPEEPTKHWNNVSFCWKQVAKPRTGKDGKKGGSSEKVVLIFALEDQALNENGQETKEKEAKARARAAKSAMRARSEAELREKAGDEREGGVGDGDLGEGGRDRLHLGQDKSQYVESQDWYCLLTYIFPPKYHSNVKCFIWESKPQVPIIKILHLYRNVFCQHTMCCIEGE